jgi:hypothetical protein
MKATVPKRDKPRIVYALGIFLILEAFILLILGLNLMTHNWDFLQSWQVFWSALQRAFQLAAGTPQSVESTETLIYDVAAAAVLSVTAAASLLSGILFFREGAFTWILSMLVQIMTLGTGIALYWIYKPLQVYGLMAVGIFMVFYLNDGDVRVWFLQPQGGEEVGFGES